MEENIDNIELLKNSNETIKEETDLVQEIETKPKSNSLIKFFLFLILALFFTILGGLAVWYMGKSSKEEIKTELSPTPIASSENKVDEMDGWNTYLNEEYGFEFKYNPSWNIDIFDDSNITINNIKDNHKLRILIEQVTGFNYCFKYEETNQINIGNVIAETADGVGNSSELCDDPEKYLNLGNTFILIPIDKSIHSPKQILISYEYPLSDISFAKVNLDRILSTFKFMDMEDEVANWKTYRNEEYGFEFKYPNNITLGGLTLDPNPGIILTMRGPTQKAQTELYDGISLRIYFPFISNDSVKEIVDKEIQTIKGNDIAELIAEPSVFKNNFINGFSYTVRGLGEHRYIYFSDEDKDYLYHIADSTNDPGELGFNETVDQILSTFKFID